VACVAKSDYAVASMKRSTLAPEAHLFVCTNRRDPSSPLGGGCGDRGEALYHALKAHVSSRGQVRALWIARSTCLGLCPKQGCAVASAPGPAYWIEATDADADVIAADALSRARI
jgi:predicted metal-binding protein